MRKKKLISTDRVGNATLGLLLNSFLVIQFRNASEIHFPNSFDPPMGRPTSKCHVKSTKQSKAQQETKTEGKLCISGPAVQWALTALRLQSRALPAGRRAAVHAAGCTHCSFCSISRPGSVFSPRPVPGPTVPGRKISNFFAGFLDSSLLTEIYVAVL